MKPIKLVIEGLNSFETKQELDFESLTGGVFGIFGKTGSGKSTILDAITLSLYGKVERTKQNIDFINTKCSKATVTFRFSMLNSGKDKIYEITRTFSKKKNGKDIDSDAELYELDGEDKKLIEQGTTKVNDKIFGIVGLGVNEFAKCIALPQGEFSAFLQAKPSERTEIMSNIFNLSQYGDELMQKVKNKLNEFDKQVSTLSASKTMVDYATDEKLESLTTELAGKKQEYELASNELQRLSSSWGEQKQTLEKLKTLSEITGKLNELETKKDEMLLVQQEIEKSQTANQLKTDFEKLKKDESDAKELTNKITELGELKLKKASQVVESETHFNDIKTIFDDRIIELNSKLGKLTELVRLDEEIKIAEKKKQEAKDAISSKQKEVESESQNNEYLENNIAKLQEQIDEIDDFIDTNKADVELTYALEQTKGVESEIILLDEVLFSLGKLIDQTNADIKQAHEDYNEAIAKEKHLRQSQEKIENSIEVAFEDSDSNNFTKLRSCDKQLENMREVNQELENIDRLIARLIADSEARTMTIEQINETITQEQANLNNIESMIAKKEVELESNQEAREELLGENVISMISEHLQVGDSCPVCSSNVQTKIYAEKTDFSPIESEIKSNKVRLKNLRFERDKILASLVSFKSRIEFEKNQITKNNAEIENLHNGKDSLYLKFVDSNDESAENFKKLYGLLQNTVVSLENLIDLQDTVREDEKQALINKVQAGSRLTIYESYLESLTDISYTLQKKKAEREFVIINVNEKYKNLSEFKKQIAEGKNIELLIDDKKENRAKLKDQQFELISQKSKSDVLIEKLKSDMMLMQERIETSEQTIAGLNTKILASGVPEGASVEDEKVQTENAIKQLRAEYAEKQSLFETNKEALSRIENDYTVSQSILDSKNAEIEILNSKITASLENNGFSDFSELENCFMDNSTLKLKQEKVNDYNNECKVLEMQKKSLEEENLQEINTEELNNTEKEIAKLNETVKDLSETIGKLGAELERLAVDNQKLKEISSNLEIFTHKLDLVKELSSVLRGKALAEFVCEEYLQEITSSANQKLEILMDGRYTLKFENKEFFVEDNFNDGKTRPASTLSGGETFVVSLSLALSISNAISMLSTRSMDFFFLDEGFGTLDNELCSVVINSLYKLESQNLKIGLISHVSELEESIKNKVIVTKDNNGTKLKLEHSL